MNFRGFAWSPPSSRRPRTWILILIAGLALVAAGVVAGVVTPFMTGALLRKARAGVATDDPVDANAKPTVITSVPHKFSITFPPPYYMPEENSTLLKSVPLTTWISMGKNGALSAAVAVYPDSTFKGASLQGFLQETHFAIVRDLGGRVEAQEDFLFEGHPALRSVVDHPERKGQRGYSRVELILVPPRLYMIRTSHSRRDALDSPSLKAFAESFHLTP